MNTIDRNKILDKMEIGQIKLVTDWLNKFHLPYNKEDIKRIVDEKGHTKAFEILMDKDTILKLYRDEKYIPEFIQKGNIKITITL